MIWLRVAKQAPAKSGAWRSDYGMMRAITGSQLRDRIPELADHYNSSILATARGGLSVPAVARLNLVALRENVLYFTKCGDLPTS